MSLSSSLAPLWADIAAGTAQGYARDLAADAGATEAQLVAAGIGNGATRLDIDWISALPRLEDLGEVKIITRNDAIVHEKVGSFGKMSIMQSTGLVLNGMVDLRIFFAHWQHSFVVTTTSSRGPRTGIQIFDLHGNAVHKIYRTANTNGDAWDAFIRDFTAADQSPELTVLAPAQAPLLRADADVDVDGLRARWAALKDVHHFHDMLKDSGVSRIQAMRLVGEPWAREVTSDALDLLLPQAADSALPIMIFVGNPGCIQIHTGPVSKIVDHKGWINIMDPSFTLHTKRSEITSAWVVRKPMHGTTITTVELYDRRGDNCAILCAQRDPSAPERPEWTALASSLPSPQTAAAA